MIKIETYIDKQKKNVYKGKAHYGGVLIRRLRFLAFFFFFFSRVSRSNVAIVHEQ